VCLLTGAVLLFVAWYDVSGTADVYRQLPYLVSAGFTGLALIIVGSALLIAGRGERIDQRLAQLLDAITEAAAPSVGSNDSSDAGNDAAVTNADAVDGPAPQAGFVAVEGGRTYHLPDCLLLRGKQTSPVSSEDVSAKALTPCPVCGPSPQR
jgi:hypothetical protein